eukprot:TRINITY_DN7924_c1_g1_i1.p1 TRINITY_DN7924_c1_g1~~TRINITY_DN7924_c1_g1_i1.p1  ORF type:complete len:455 (-),score=154.28 TRINITY_DN7924_c1_g1_i1:92-1456(-)
MKQFLYLVVIVLVFKCCLCAVPHPKREIGDSNWSPVDNALNQWIKNFAYPGCVALVANEKEILYFKAFGNYTYGAPPPLNAPNNPPMELDTIFDLASCTKVTGATTAIAQFYERGELDLNTKVEDILGKQFGTNGKDQISVLNCLLHNAGFPPDPDPNYWDPLFGCPETSQTYPQENFSCQTKAWNGLMNQTLENPVGSIYVYSDLSFITLMHVVGKLAKENNYITVSDLIPECNTGGPGVTQCYFEAYLRKYVFETLGMKQTQYLPPNSLWSKCATTENDTLSDQYQNIVIQGQVSDGNAYALGGIAGHAGLFSTAYDLYLLTHHIMFPDSYAQPFLNSTTTTFFTTEYNHTQSCRALGWSTNDPTVVDEGWNLSCGNFSAKTWTHIGYTGTQICADPNLDVFTVFLTNRVYPIAANDQMNSARRSFNNAVLEVVNSDPSRYLSSSLSSKKDK